MSDTRTDEQTIRELFRIVERDTLHYHAAVSALDRMTARISELEAAHEAIGICGNHLASALIHWLGAGDAAFPPYTATLDEAHKIIPDILHWDAWVCWRAIMQARDALRPDDAAAASAILPKANAPCLGLGVRYIHTAGTVEQCAGCADHEARRLEKVKK